MARLTAQEKVVRDAGIVADRERGVPWRVIAEQHGLSERQCRNVWNARDGALLVRVRLSDAFAAAVRARLLASGATSLESDVTLPPDVLVASSRSLLKWLAYSSVGT